MAITLTSLYPSKNAVGIPVDANIEVRLESDAAELDVKSVQFFINDIEVKPSSRYSVDIGYGQDKNKIDLTFFARRRIKFANERYGAIDTRYGKLDIYPSNFLYGLRYVCRVVVKDVNGVEFSDHFAFTIEDGIFYNQSAEDYFYSSNTQELANYLPDWAKARYDKFSNFQQMVNPAGVFLEEIDNKIQYDLSNSFVQTANYNELSTLYKVEMGASYDFKTTILDDGTSLQVPPDVAGKLNISILYPNAEFSNDIKAVYYNKLPTRIETEREKLGDNVIISKFAIDVNRINLTDDLRRFGTVCLKMEDGNKFSKIDAITGDLSILVARVKGVSPQNVEQQEDIIIIDNDHYFTKKRWKRIDSLQFINIPDDSNIHCTLQYLQDPTGYVLDTFRYTGTDGSTKTTYWKLDTSDYGSVLSQNVFVATEVDDIISSLGQKTPVIEYELLDVDGQTNLELLAVAPDLFSNFLYGIDEDYLYVFDKREPYTNVIEYLPRNAGDPDFVLDLATDSLGRGDSVKIVEIAGIQKLIGKQMVKYRLSVRFPDGTTRYIKTDGTLTLNKNEAIAAIGRNERQVFTKSIDVELPDLGDYVFFAEASYADGSSSIDAKIARLMSKPAMSKYKLYRSLLGNSPVNLVRDFDGQLKILDETGLLHTLYLCKDNMLVDYENSVLYFNQKYDEITVDE